MTSNTRGTTVEERLTRALQNAGVTATHAQLSLLHGFVIHERETAKRDASSRFETMLSNTAQAMHADDLDTRRVNAEWDDMSDEGRAWYLDNARTVMPILAAAWHHARTAPAGARNPYEEEA